MALKHKDIEFYLDNTAKSKSSYEDAVVAAVNRSFVSGKQIRIRVFAYSQAGVRWYESNFSGGLNLPKKSFSDDEGQQIDVLKIKAS